MENRLIHLCKKIQEGCYRETFLRFLFFQLFFEIVWLLWKNENSNSNSKKTGEQREFSLASSNFPLLRVIVRHA
jgi:hypothetical protein